jgi:hypothetical protein
MFKNVDDVTQLTKNTGGISWKKPLFEGWRNPAAS